MGFLPCGDVQSMKVRLIPLGCKIANLALMKLSAFHKTRGDEVSLDEPSPNLVYVSSPFSKYKGVDYSHMFPDATRGCIRNCFFCIVPNMEGMIRKNSPIEEFHNPEHDTVELLDNNILYFEDWFMRNTDYPIKNDLKVIENGIDIRLVNKKNAGRLHELNMKSDRLHFAFDDLSYEKEVRRGIEILENAGFKPRYLMCYILAWPGGFEDAWKRLEIIWKDYHIDPFVQVYNNSRKDKRIRKLARWCNKPQLRKSCEFGEYRDRR